MNLLNIPLPDDLAPNAGLDGPARVCVAADLRPDGTLGAQWLVVTNRTVYLLSREERVTIIVWSRRISDISEPKTLTFIGGGALEATVDGEKQVLERYTGARHGQFNTVAGLLEKWSKGEEAEVPEEESHRCPTCGLPLRKGSRVCPACIPKSRTLKRLLGYLVPVRGMALSLMGVSLLATALGMIPPLLQRPLYDMVLAPKPGTVETPERYRLLLLLTLGLLAVALVGSMLGVLQSWISSWLGNRVTHNIRCQLFQHLQYLSLSFYDKRQMGSVISRVNQDSGGLQHFLTWGAQEMVTNLLLFLGVGAMMFVINWKLALLVVLVVPFISAIGGQVWRRLRHVMHRIYHRWGRVNAMLSESLTGLRVIKAFAQEDREIERFSTRSDELFMPTVNIERTWAIAFAGIGLLFGISRLLVGYVGGMEILGEHMTIGELAAFTMYAAMFDGPLRHLSMLLNWSSRSFAAAERIFEILDTEPEPHDQRQATIPPIEGRLEFRHVTFGYERARTALKDLSFTLEPGEMIGLVGHSGAGKSTIINLVCRFYEPQQGEVLIDGLRIADLPLEGWREQIGLVPQDTFLFSGTIAENIAYARPGATREEIIRAAKVANAHDFILRKPDGYDTLIGEGGQGLSAGEKQRLAIARAVLHNPRILILDEATSQVDVETEKQIQEAIDRLVAGRTTIAIAHRLSTLKNAHRLIVLKSGEVVEIGTHDELLQKEDGEFRRLVTMYQEVSKVREVGR
ncbi:MAG: putative ABC transporter ATP-binding protein [bacterium ADurb.Bin429]|nr:MAG: putative ABC transporter ATP-binding protein [bacterium ADurb.Bin429]